MAIVDTSTSEPQEPQEAQPVAPNLDRVDGYTSPEAEQLVFKDECNYCFNTPFSEGGLYVCLKYFVGLCQEHIRSYLNANPEAKFFLHYQSKKIESADTDEPKDKMQRLCIAAEKEESEETTLLVIAPDLETKYELNDQNIPADLSEVIRQTVQHPSATLQQRLNSGVSEWDGESRLNAKDFDRLIQLDIDHDIPYSGWVCQEPGCELTENLWLNLSDGTIKCGRSQYLADGKVTKGNSHAKKHAEETGFPLAVKLGTISKSDADVYSYGENESVRDPLLRQHLAHFGLDIAKFEKTEKSTFEMELDLNQKWEWSRCLEDGVTLENAFGPGFTGLINIGSSCYMNSVLQCLCEDSNFVQASENAFRTDLKASALLELHDDFIFQLARLVHSLRGSKYSRAGQETNGIRPTQFKKVAGRGHEEFSTAKQQDAEEYIRHLLSKFEDHPEFKPNPVEDFRFRVVKRFQDVASLKVRYQDTDDLILSLPIPKDKLQDAPLPPDLASTIIPMLPENQPGKQIDLTLLIENFSAQQFIDGFTSPITNEPKGALQQYRIASFPDILTIQINRFEHDSNYQPRKLQVEVIVPDSLDLTPFRFEGQQAGEELLPDSIQVPVIEPQPPAFALNLTYVKEVMDLGFSRNAAERAVYATKNSSPDEAAEWVLSRAGDPEIDTPHPDLVRGRLTAGGADSKKRKEEANIKELMSLLGVSTYQAKYSLDQAGGDLNAAAEWYFQNVDDIPPAPTEPEPVEPLQSQPEPAESSESQPEVQKRPVKDGPGRYELVAFITHMGRSPQSGHYVCHIKRDGNWYLFNDEKVALSHSPPKSMGYIYFYRRVAE